jgi:hypothetical protein
LEEGTGTLRREPGGHGGGKSPLPADFSFACSVFFGEVEKERTDCNGLEIVSISNVLVSSEEVLLLDESVDCTVLTTNGALRGFTCRSRNCIGKGDDNDLEGGSCLFEEIEDSFSRL